MDKNFISNSPESVRMFKSNLMEAMSKVSYKVPLFIYVPAIIVLIYLSFRFGVSTLNFLWLFPLGIVIWTFTEYFLHRFVFHFVPKSKWGQRLHFIFHGVHHDYPQDSKRLVMPPSASIPLAVLFYFIFSLFFKEEGNLLAFFSGFILGYLIYDMLHYAFHHYQFKSKIMLKLKAQHMQHHYTDPHKGYGVSNMLWDEIFHTEFPPRKNATTKIKVSK